MNSKITMIGLVDFDVLYGHTYKCPNYDLAVVYAYLKNDKNINVRLVSSFSLQNLQQYDKIYIFKQNSIIPHPVTVIKDYYKLPIEEYGPGFIEKPLRPFLLETKYILPDASCYNNMILYSMSHKHSKISWKISRQAKGGKYKLIRLYEMFEGEELLKDYPVERYNIIYDDPIDIVLNKQKWDYFNQLLDQKKIFTFAQSLDISKITDTNILEQIISERKYACLRKSLIATEINDTVEWLINLLLERRHLNKLHTISVLLPKEQGPERCLEVMLLIKYYNCKMYDKQLRVQLGRLEAYGREEWFTGYDLALFAFRYLHGTPDKMSYYEYVFNIACLRAGVPPHIIHTGEEQYEHILQKYGMPSTLVFLERWIQKHPQFEEMVFIGGSSNYERQRTKYYDKRRSGFNVRTSASNIS